jgi:hypothetical protein
MRRAVFPFADTNSHRGVLRRHRHRCNLFRGMVQVYGHQVILRFPSLRQAASSDRNTTFCWRNTSVSVDSSFHIGNHGVLASSRARILVCQRIRGGVDTVHVPCHMGWCDRPLVRHINWTGLPTCRKEQSHLQCLRHTEFNVAGRAQATCVLAMRIWPDTRPALLRTCTRTYSTYLMIFFLTVPSPSLLPSSPTNLKRAFMTLSTRTTLSTVWRRLNRSAYMVGSHYLQGPSSVSS